MLGLKCRKIQDEIFWMGTLWAYPLLPFLAFPSQRRADQRFLMIGLPRIDRKPLPRGDAGWGNVRFQSQYIARVAQFRNREDGRCGNERRQDDANGFGTSLG